MHGLYKAHRTVLCFNVCIMLALATLMWQDKRMIRYHDLPNVDK